MSAQPLSPAPPGGESLNSLPSRSLSCKTLDFGVISAAQIAGLGLQHNGEVMSPHQLAKTLQDPLWKKRIYKLCMLMYIAQDAQKLLKMLENNEASAAPWKHIKAPLWWKQTLTLPSRPIGLRRRSRSESSRSPKTHLPRRWVRRAVKSALCLYTYFARQVTNERCDSSTATPSTEAS